MAPLVIDFDISIGCLAVSGATRDVWRNRRVGIFLRDYLKATLTENDVIHIPAVGLQLGPLLRSVEDALSRAGFSCEVAQSLTDSVLDFVNAEAQFSEFSQRAKDIWENQIQTQEFRDFADVLSERVSGRRLYNLQLLAAYHLAFAQNAANFSAPGAGKTSIVYGAFAFLNSLSVEDPRYVNKLLVIGPLSSFGPWEIEFRECFSRQPRSFRIAGGASSDYRKRVLYSELPEFKGSELVLTSYQSVANQLKDLQHFLTRPWNRVMVVLDEAHKIKNSSGGIWAESVLELARFCPARVVLTGTPAPNGYEDLYNLFKFIWPDQNVIKFHIQHLKDMTQNPLDRRIDQLVENLSPFFIRIRKSDLGLPKPIEHPPIIVPMGPRQRHIYSFIEEKYVAYFDGRAGDSWIRDALTKARLVRLMQAATNPALLKVPLEAVASEDALSFDSSLFIDDAEVLEEISSYVETETPTKLQAAVDLVVEILGRSDKNKVVVWCVFVANLFAVQDLLSGVGIEAKILYGGTPTENDDTEESIETREKIVREFQSDESSFRVVIANPFAVGESISLHKTCHNAIYLERNFNAAAFLQSKDRIHRYGLPAEARINYYYLASHNSVDTTIHDRLLQKEVVMMKVLESKVIPLISLNMDQADSDGDDVSAIIRDYAKRNSTS